MRRLFIFLYILISTFAFSENYLINGGQESKIRYELTQRFEPAQGTKSVLLSFVIPETFDSPTYKQTVSNFNLKFNPQPTSKKEKRDKRGNQIIEVTWKNPETNVDVSMSFIASNTTLLKPLKSSAEFPLTNIPGDVKPYLEATDQVPVNHSQMNARAKEITRGVKTEFDAVQRILTWVIDHMRYVTPPKQYDALYSFETGKGNCQNYSHLAATLMRAVGIPVRIVNGVTLKEPYTVKTADGEFTFKMGQGRHSWIEVYFTDLGWVPFDPQQSELFVSNRFIRCEVGLDNNECINDGTVRWRQAKGVQGRPKFQENIASEFFQDHVSLAIEKQSYGPKNMLLCPAVQTEFKQVVVAKPPPPKKVSKSELKTLKYNKPYLFGNLDYPKGVNFLLTRGPAEKADEDEYQMRKNFMVETAEYVTTKMTQYAQVFILKKPMRLKKVGLALQKFGGSGQVWIDLMKDENGKPGATITSSDFMALNQIPQKFAYDWVDFDFGTQGPVLAPGKYWIGLGFTGSAILNWYYTYGKPVGPIDGTRYKGVYDEKWSGALAYEFNYRVAGWAAE